MLKPILFNTDMVRAILDGRKTVTRRVIKPHFRPGEVGWQVITEKHSGKYVRIEYLDEWENETRYMSEPFRPGDILYVRETWAEMPYGYVYRADDERPEGWDSEDRWRPSIHMPKEAARIFLRVKSVRVDRLQNITDEDIEAEGMEIGCYFDELWNSTIKPADLETYGWEANPLVWVIEFERCEKEEAYEQGN